MQITGIILSGGQSTRMGTDKALMQINGKTLLENVIHICQPLCSQILISSNNLAHEKFGYKIIPDEIKNCGPLGGIYSCLKQSETDWNFIISVDAAFIKPEFVSFLISEIGDYNAVVPVHDFGKEPLIAMYHKKGLPEITKMLVSKNYKMNNLLNLINTKFVDSQKWVKEFPEIFRNLNHPCDI
jgi:molybdopterin-guanine dinucleotide biosynthesis protein A